MENEPGDRLPEPGRFDSAADFGTALTSLKQRTAVSLRQLSSASGLGFSTINGYCRGRHLPQAGVGEQFRALLHALGVTAERDQEEWLVAADRLRRTKSAAESDATNPYPGLRPYDVGEDRFFYGRAPLVVDLTGMAATVRKPVVVVGPSGAGKSSLLRAGLIPAMCATRTPVLFTPGPSPMHELARRLDGDPAAVTGQSLLIVVDQLEEIFAPQVDATERERFLAALTSLAAAESISVVLGLRADFYDRALRLPHLAEPLRDAQFIVPAMNAEELRQVITEPARAVGKDVESAVVERVLGEIAPREASRGTTAHEPGALPLLAHVLHEAYTLSCGAKSLTLEHYASTGGVAEALARTADAACEKLSEQQQQLARRLLLSMVHVGEATAETRRRLSIDEVTAARPDAELEDLADVLDSFISHRLLTADADSVEISHEALLVHWPRLRGWIDEARDQMRVHHHVADGARSWLAHGRDPGELARGPRLDAMRTLVEDDTEGVLLSTDEKDFVTASIRAQRSRHRRLRLLAIAMTVLAVLTTAFAGMFAVARQQATTARDEALSRQMAVIARQLAADDPAAAVQLAIAGYRVAPTTDARSAMLDLASGAFPRRLPPAANGYPAAASSHSGRRLAVSHTGDAVVRIYQVAESSQVLAGQVELRGAPLETWQTYSVALSPDGNLLVAQESMTGIGLWDIADPKRPNRLGGMTGPHGVQDLAITADGGELAAVGLADDVHRWNISDPAAPRPLPRIVTPGKLHSVAYAPQGDLLAVGDADATVELWDPAGRQVAELPAGEGRLSTVAFSPDGRTLTAGTARGRTVSAWNITDRTRPRQVEIADPKFDSWVNRLTFSPDGSLLLAASSESVVRVWDTGTWQTVADLPHPGEVGWVGFGSSTAAVTTSTDGTVWNWDLRTAVPPRMPGRAWRTAFAVKTGQLAVFAEGKTVLWPGTGVPGEPDRVVTDTGGEKSIGDGDITADGSLLVQSYVGGKVAVFGLPGEPERLSEFRGDTVNIVQSLALSPDGRLVATGGDDTTVRLHDISDPRHPKVVAELPEPTGKVLGVRWRPQGDLLAAATAGGKVFVYDVSDPAHAHQVAVLDDFEGDVHLAEFSPDGTRLAAGGIDSVIRLWDVSDPGRPSPLGDPISGPVNLIPKLAFHPDGSMLAAVDSKGAVWLFDITDPVRPTRYATLTPGIGQMNSLAFHPRGKVLAAASVPGVVRSWQLDENEVIARACAAIGERITEQTWHTHLPEIDYQPPC